MRDIRPGQFYRHFKDRLYQIVAVAEHSETREQLVIYQALYGDYRTYARPYDMFVSEVDHEKYPEVTQKYRFELVELSEKEPESEAKLCGEESEGAAKFSEKEPECSAEIPEKEPENAALQDRGDIPAAGSGEFADGEVNPILLEFLDADTLEEKIHIMIIYRNKMDENLLNSIAISLDVVVEKKGVQEKYDEIMNCLSMMEKFECNRFR